jgi:hypothetical protein
MVRDTYSCDKPMPTKGEKVCCSDHIAAESRKKAQPRGRAIKRGVTSAGDLKGKGSPAAKWPDLGFSRAVKISGRRARCLSHTAHG